MKENLEKMLDAIDTYETNMYSNLIDLHQDGRLREVTKKYAPGYGFGIITSPYGSSTELYYSDEGFKVNIPTYHGGDTWADSGYYNSKYYSCKVKDEKLVLKYGKQGQELLELFPKLKIEDVMKGIEKGLGSTKIYQEAKGGN